MEPKASIIIATHSFEGYKYLVKALESLANQTYSNIEAIVVVDNNVKLCDFLEKQRREGVLKDLNIEIKILLNLGKKGLSASRNVGVLNASGEIICFLDDDAIADKHWVEELIKTYNDYPEALGVGGPILPLGKIPWWMPKDFYWLLGVTPPSLHSNNITRIRNTFGSNISFRKEVFEKVGLFNEGLGFSGTKLIQAEEVEICIRCIKKLKGVILYNPKAIVYHHILPQRTKLSYLLKRAYDQGLSKAILKSLHKDFNTLRVEYKYLIKVLRNILSSLAIMSIKGLTQALFSIAFTASVGVGYLSGKIYSYAKK